MIGLLSGREVGIAAGVGTPAGQAGGLKSELRWEVDSLLVYCARKTLWFLDCETRNSASEDSAGVAAATVIRCGPLDTVAEF